MRERLGGRLLGALVGAVALTSVLLGVASPAAAQLVIDPGTVIHTIATSAWSPPSPDPSGITWRPDTSQLITCDSEVEETIGGITHYQGVNVWTHSTAGVVASTADTTWFSTEPTGCYFDPAGGHIFFSDDVKFVIFDVHFGPDGIYGTPDDTRVQLKGYKALGCTDMEDVTYDSFDGHLYIAAGNAGICRIGVGANGVFDSAPPFGDDEVSMISVSSFGIIDLEGIVYDPFWDTLVLADRGTRDLYELTPQGNFLRKIDVNFPGDVKPSGVTIAPGTTNPSLRNYYVTDRHVDNDGTPTENDGRIFEVVAIPLGGNGAPIVDAGPGRLIQWPTNSVGLEGYVSDDGHPYPPSTVLARWTQQSGPGSVTFENDSSPITTATFSAPGTYVLQLEGDDSELQSVDTVHVHVTSGSGTNCGIGPELAALLLGLRWARGRRRERQASSPPEREERYSRNAARL